MVIYHAACEYSMLCVLVLLCQTIEIVYVKSEKWRDSNVSLIESFLCGLLEEKSVLKLESITLRVIIQSWKNSFKINDINIMLLDMGASLPPKNK